MPSITFNDLGRAAYQIIGVVGEAGTPTAIQMAKAMEQANILLDDYAADRSMIYQVPRQSFVLVSGVGEYTIGPGGDFDVARPETIQDATLVIQESPLIEIGLGVYDNADDWADVIAKGITGLPFAIFNDMAFPLSTITVYPEPQGGPYKLALYLPTAIEAFDTTDYTIEYSFPPGYLDSILLRLARRLLIFYPRPVSQDLRALLDEAEHLVITNNVYVPVLQVEESLATRTRRSDRWYGQWLVPPYMR